MKSLLLKLACIALIASWVNCECGEDCIDCDPTMNICIVCRGSIESDVFGNCHNNTIDKCITYGPTGDCLRCQNTFTLSNGGCVKSFTGCTNEGSGGECYECGFGRMVEGSSCKGVINCATYSQTCLNCAQGYTLQNNICKDNSEGCAEVRPEDGLCGSCKAGYFYSGYRCFENKYLNEKCYVLLNNNYCLYCKSGYNTLNGQCLLSREIPPDQDVRGVGIQPTNGDTGKHGQQSTSPSTSTQTQNQTQTILISPAPTTTRSPTPPPSTTTTTTITTTSTFVPSPPQNTRITILSVTVSDQNCRQFSGSICISCSNRYYVGPQSKCIPVNPLCKENNNQGDCTSCYSGYIVQQGKCILGPQRDTNCRSFKGETCTGCYPGFYYNSATSTCKKLNPLCKASNMATGACLSCYPGYAVNTNTGTCVMSAKDNYCKNFKPDGSCSLCSSRYYLGRDGKCVMANPLCKDYDPYSGGCVSCYQGYIVSGSTCIVGTNIDPNCKIFTGSACSTCFGGFYLNNNKCQQISPLCKSFNEFTGACTSCYSGFDLQGSQCIVNQDKDTNCRKFDNNNRKLCIQCYSGYIVANGVCTVQNPLCKTIDVGNGACQSCWQGYVISGRTCILDPQSDSSSTQDPFCIKFVNGVCSECSSGYFYSRSVGLCQQLDPLCKSSDMSNGNCVGCYSGYSLTSSFKCQITPVIQILNCNEVDSSGMCRQCLEGYYLANNQCNQVPIQCATYNRRTGQCLTCIDQHFFQDGTCIYPGLFDDNCVRYESAYCSRCKIGYYVSSYQCKQIDVSCSAFDYDNIMCTACIGNKRPLGPDCV